MKRFAVNAAFVLTLAVASWQAAPAMAQSADPAPYRAVFEACLAGAAADPVAARACIGRAASACMTREDGGETTFGMTGCTAMENGLWDEVLNADWPRHRASAKAQDEAERPYFDGQFSKADESLLAAQRAWIAFRDADCAAAAASWGSGSMRHIEYAACLLDHTANRVLDLRAQWEKF